MTWAQISGQVIAEVIKSNPGLSKAELRKLCNDAYPFGEKSMFPYKAWCKSLNDHFGPSPQKVKADKKKIDEIRKRSGQVTLMEGE